MHMPFDAAVRWNTFATTTLKLADLPRNTKVDASSGCNVAASLTISLTITPLALLHIVCHQGRIKETRQSGSDWMGQCSCATPLPSLLFNLLVTVIIMILDLQLQERAEDGQGSSQNVA